MPRELRPAPADLADTMVNMSQAELKAHYRCSGKTALGWISTMPIELRRARYAVIHERRCAAIRTRNRALGYAPMAERPVVPDDDRNDAVRGSAMLRDAWDRLSLRMAQDQQLAA